MDSLAVGIDLGTTNICVAVYRNNQVEVIINKQGKRTTPSWISFKEGEILTGQDAKDNAHVNIKNTLFETKRLIGQNYNNPKVQEDIARFPFDVVEDLGCPKIIIEHNGETKYFQPEEICSHLLEAVKKWTDEYLRQNIRRAVITVPTYFNSARRQATIDAAKLAGFQTVNIIDEPTAAALALANMYKKDYKRNVLVYDFGGGTFDVSIVTVETRTCKVIATDGECHLGGTDIDLNLCKYFKKHFQEKFGKEMEDTVSANRRLKFICENIKEKLSSKVEARVDLENMSGEDYVPCISRARFEELNSYLFEKTISIVERCLNDANLKADDIDEVILIGGSSRIPKVQEMLNEYFIHKVNNTINPDEGVAYGAAIYAKQLVGDKIEDPPAKVDVSYQTSVSNQGNDNNETYKQENTLKCNETYIEANALNKQAKQIPKEDEIKTIVQQQILQQLPSVLLHYGNGQYLNAQNEQNILSRIDYLEKHAKSMNDILQSFNTKLSLIHDKLIQCEQNFKVYKDKKCDDTEKTEQTGEDCEPTPTVQEEITPETISEPIASSSYTLNQNLQNEFSVASRTENEKDLKTLSKIEENVMKIGTKIPNFQNVKDEHEFKVTKNQLIKTMIRLDSIENESPEIETRVTRSLTDCQKHLNQLREYQSRNKMAKSVNDENFTVTDEWNYSFRDVDDVSDDDSN